VNVYVPRVALWPEQKTALQRMEGREAFALLMAMRTGKTATVLADFGRLLYQGKVEALLVIAPAGVYRTWISALDEHYAGDISTHVWKS